MGRIKPWFVLAVLLASAPAAAIEWLPATVHLSDGSALVGRVAVPGDSILIHVEAQGRRFSVRLAEMQAIENVIETQSMERKWIFKESGLDDKIYTGEHFPVRHYLTNVTFHDGRRLSGHMIAKTLYVEANEERHRFILRQKQEGDVDEDLTDLTYVRSVVFSDEGAGARGTIEGALELPFGEQLQKVLAINRDKLFSVEARFNANAGTFRVGDCTEGTYDIVVVTNKAIYAGFSRERDEGAGRLDSEAVADIQPWVDKLRDFFHSQKILYGAGNRERAFVLIWKERRGGTTLGGLERLHRYDVWAMHKPKAEWQIEKRMYLWRVPSGDVGLEPLDVVVVPALGGHSISAEADSRDLRIQLLRSEEPPIPPPAREGEQENGQ